MAVDIESKTVKAGQQGVTLDLIAYWDIDLSLLAVPTIVREIDPGAFWTGALPFDTSGKAHYHPYVQGVTWNWRDDFAVLVEELRPGAPDPPCVPGEDAGYNGISPDYSALAGVRAHGPNGLPPEPDGFPVVTIVFDVTENPGQFEFDTACYAAFSYPLHMFDSYFPPVAAPVTFNKGVITIAACDCPFPGDATGDKTIDVADLVYLINYALRGGPSPVSDPDCPAIHRGDRDCSGGINLLDIVHTINYLFRPPAPGPCDPCG